MTCLTSHLSLPSDCDNILAAWTDLGDITFCSSLILSVLSLCSSTSRL